MVVAGAAQGVQEGLQRRIGVDPVVTAGQLCQAFAQTDHVAHVLIEARRDLSFEIVAWAVRYPTSLQAGQAKHERSQAGQVGHVFFGTQPRISAIGADQRLAEVAAAHRKALDPGMFAHLLDRIDHVEVHARIEAGGCSLDVHRVSSSVSLRLARL